MLRISAALLAFTCSCALVAAESAQLKPTFDPGQPPATLVTTASTLAAKPAAVAATAAATTVVQDALPTMIPSSAFPEVLVPSAPATQEGADDVALRAQLPTWETGDRVAAMDAVAGFLTAYPDSRWRIALQVNRGIRYREVGLISQAIACWGDAWTRGKSLTSGPAKLLAERAFAELVQLNAWVGRPDAIDAYLAELGTRDLTGLAGTKLAAARAGRKSMALDPGQSFKCGPYAVGRLADPQRKHDAIYQLIMQAQSTAQGTNLLQVRELAKQAGLELQIAKRAPGAEVITPAIVHWSLNHYSALTGVVNGTYAIQDTTMDMYYGTALRVPRRCLDEEMSGYCLVRTGTLPNGWAAVPDAEAAAVWGRGATGGNKDPNGCSPTDPHFPICPTPPAHGMPIASVKAMLVGLHIEDIPLWYAPINGLSVNVGVTYNEKEANQPTIWATSNIGPKWSFGWTTWIQVTTRDGANRPVTGLMVPSAGGAYPFTLSASGSDAVGMVIQTGDRLQWKSATNEMVVSSADNSLAVYGLYDGSNHWSLTKQLDPFGNALVFAYDASHRLISVTDAVGQATTLAYGATDPLLITQVSDPFGRSTSFTYDSGRLSSITDMGGLTSSFAYDGSSDVITSMTTPYGTTSVARGTGADFQQWIEWTDPMGDKQRVESRANAPIPTDEPVPAFMAGGVYLTYRNSFYWDRKAMRLAPGDYTKARIYHWTHTDDWNSTGRILESLKEPLENRIWYRYPGQTNPIKDEGITLAKPSLVSRILDDGSTQSSTFTYTAAGQVASSVDPLGRTRVVTYSVSGDPVQVSQVVSGGTASVFLQGATWNAQHQPLTLTDASGRVTTLVYSAAVGAQPGLLQTVTLPPRSGQPTSTYNIGYFANGALQSITDSLGGITSLTYDAYSRVRTVTDQRDSYTITYDYDLFDRSTQATYPDGTYEGYAYDRLDQVWARDRQGRWTRTYVNAVRQVVAVQDPNNAITAYEWCKCGALQGLTDANGNVTKWKYDVQGHLLQKLFADGTSLAYTYQPQSGRLVSVTDAKGQITSYSWNHDDSLAGISYSGGVGGSTAPVSFAYDSEFPRLTGRTDQIGTTTYAFNPYQAISSVVATTGAGALASVSGPWANSTVSLNYDEWGRSISQTLNGSTSTVSYDVIGRETASTNPLGTFTPAYQGITDRVVSRALPGGMAQVFTWLGTGQDLRLGGIRWNRSGGARISEHSYTYAAAGDILSWTQTQDSATPTVWSFGYDGSDQLTAAVQRQSSTLISAAGFQYDAAGNRTSTQTTTPTTAAVWSGASNSLNQLTSAGPGGKLRVDGHLDESASVQINGVDTPMATDRSFHGVVDVTPGTTQFTVKATDLKGNIKTDTFSVNSSGGLPSRSLQYDLNGNLISDGVSTYTWDHANRLISVTSGTKQSTFLYDGLGRRVGITDKDSGVTVADRRFLWAGSTIVDERNVANVVQKRFFDAGVQVLAGASAGLYLYTRDYLGSIRELVDLTGTVRARYAYDAWGVYSKVTGDLDADFGYTGHFLHRASGLTLTLYRVYDPTLARWLSRDPLEEIGGVNLYGYVSNNPIKHFDPYGLEDVEPRPRYIPVDANGDPLPLPRIPAGQPGSGGPAPSTPDPHSQIGLRDGTKGPYVQTRTWPGNNGNPIETDWSDHGLPRVPGHTDPHDHFWGPNPTGGSPIRGPAIPRLPGFLPWLQIIPMILDPEGLIWDIIDPDGVDPRNPNFRSSPVNNCS